MHIADIEKMTAKFSEARNKLAGLITNLEDDVRSIKRRHLPAIRKAISTTADAKEQLQAAIDGNRHLFEKPRTYIWHGIKVGINKGKGEIIVSNPDKVIELIRKHLPEHADVLIKVDEKPIKKAMANLSVQELRKIGVTLEEAGDMVVIRAVDGELDKLIDAVMAESEELQ